MAVAVSTDIQGVNKSQIIYKIRGQINTGSLQKANCWKEKKEHGLWNNNLVKIQLQSVIYCPENYSDSFKNQNLHLLLKWARVQGCGLSRQLWGMNM